MARRRLALASKGVHVNNLRWSGREGRGFEPRYPDQTKNAFHKAFFVFRQGGSMQTLASPGGGLAIYRRSGTAVCQTG